jgi:hypothetical protein
LRIRLHRSLPVRLQWLLGLSELLCQQLSSPSQVRVGHGPNVGEQRSEV